MVKFLIFTAFLSVSALATTFKIQPIEQQIQESDGLFLGNFLRSKTVTLEDGSLATQMHFKMSKEVGLESDFYGMDEVIVHFPGGKTPEKTVSVEGVPSFVSGEKVMLFIRSLDNRYWGMNLGLGTFKVINYGNEVVMVNSLFPNDTQVGQISFEHFEMKVREIKKTSLKIVQSNVYPTNSTESVSSRGPASVSEGKKRAIASVSDQSDNEEKQPDMTVFWLLVALGVTGGCFRLGKRHTHE